MSKYIPGNQKHLTLDDRLYIESSLNNGTSFKDIARFLCKDPTQPAANPVRISLRNVVQGSIQPLTFVMDVIKKSTCVQSRTSVTMMPASLTVNTMKSFLRPVPASP